MSPTTHFFEEHIENKTCTFKTSMFTISKQIHFPPITLSHPASHQQTSLCSGESLRFPHRSSKECSFTAHRRRISISLFRTKILTVVNSCGCLFVVGSYCDRWFVTVAFDDFIWCYLCGIGYRKIETVFRILGNYKIGIGFRTLGPNFGYRPILGWKHVEINSVFIRSMV